MKLKKGTSRIVLVLPALHIVVKLPVIRLRAAIEIFIDHLKRPSWLYQELFVFEVSAMHTIKWCLFFGIVSNWREFWFYQTTKHPFVTPTYFSLLGLVNIQRFEEQISRTSVDRNLFWHNLYILTDGEVMKDSHHFDDPQNYCLVDGKLKLIDYGNWRAQEVVQKYGLRIFNEFDVRTVGIS